MAKKQTRIMGLAAALSALAGVAAVSPAAANIEGPDDASVAPQGKTNGGRADVFVASGRHLLGLTVKKARDGTVVAQHESHYSHSSHSSHSSHYSGAI